MDEPRKLRVFLCYGLDDNPTPRILYQRLQKEGWIVPWMDEENLLPGQNRELEIEKELEAADVALVCISTQSLDQEGNFQKEIDSLIDVAHKKLKGSIFVIPIRLDDCEMPRSLRPWLHVDFISYESRESAYQLILKSLQRKFEVVSGNTAKSSSTHWVSSPQPRVVDDLTTTTFGGFSFVKIPKGKFIMGSRVSNDLAQSDEHPQRPYTISYDYWLTRFLVSNEQFGEYVVSNRRSHVLQKDWKKKLRQPVVNVSWHEAVDYTKWLNKVFMNEIESGLVFRLPTEAEWERASKGDSGGEWPWGNEDLDQFLNSKGIEKLRSAKKQERLDKHMYAGNFREFFSNSSRSTLSEAEKDSENISLDEFRMRLAEYRSSMELADVGSFSPLADSPYEVADMMGSVWEWTQSLYWPYPYDVDDGRENLRDSGERVVRGHFMLRSERFSVRSAKRGHLTPDRKEPYLGFRIVVAPPVS